MKNKIGTCRTEIFDHNGQRCFTQGNVYQMTPSVSGDGYTARDDHGDLWDIDYETWGGHLHCFVLTDEPTPPTTGDIINALENGLSIATDLEETGNRVCAARREDIERIIARLKEGEQNERDTEDTQ